MVRESTHKTIHGIHYSLSPMPRFSLTFQRAGALRAAEPKTSGAFHSPLMASAGEKLRAALAATPISRPRLQVYSNVAAKPYSSPEEIYEMLGQQLTSPVLWNTTIQNMKNDGIERYFETGPQTQLKSMMRRIEPALFKATTSVNVA
jgi:[acyl-carrier-protein] S-malonyltransferase